MGEMQDTGWCVEACGSGRVRSISAGTTVYNCATHAGDSYSVRRGRDVLHGVASPGWDAQQAALADAVNWILRDELASGALGDVPEWAARLMGNQLAPGAFGPFSPYHYP